MKTPAQVEDAVGAAPNQHVRIAPKIPSLDLESLIDVRVTQGVQAGIAQYDQTRLRGLKAGCMNKGLLAGPGR